MGSVHRDTRTKKPSWRVAYTKSDGLDTTKSGFRTKREAEAFLATTEVFKLQGSHIAPSDARVTIATLGEAWLAAHGAVEIVENAVMVGGQVKVGTPKTRHRRAVPYPDFLDDTVAAACVGKDRDALLFPSELGGYLRPGNGKGGWFRGAVKRAQAGEAHFPHVTPHGLRHTTASLAISTGANVKAVQRMLGHASAAMTLDVYADLFDDDLDTVAEALSRMRTEHLIRQGSDKGLVANRGDQP